MLIITDDRVLTIGEWAAAVGLSLSTARRRIADGTGPRFVRLSTRRIGVRVSDHKRWLDQQSAR
jgi:predicted DNA-binding transcriptional regulator AlpA